MVTRYVGTFHTNVMYKRYGKTFWRLLIEDDYLSSQKLPIDELEEAIFAEAPDGVFYLLDKLPEAELTLEYPSLLAKYLKGLLLKWFLS